jgi:hypothetical protein
LTLTACSYELRHDPDSLKDITTNALVADKLDEVICDIDIHIKTSQVIVPGKLLVPGVKETGACDSRPPR